MLHDTINILTQLAEIPKSNVLLEVIPQLAGLFILLIVLAWNLLRAPSDHDI
ncbi:MAG: hypothetical protein K8S56_00475 [Candidatus Cloacimonetes bacterium]|nr:hypothetical protein [Candidatus Cloacimonadota bacterium]